MMQIEELRALRQRCGDQWVLSVYLSADEHDPAMRSAWRVRLAALLDESARGAAGQAASDFRQARRYLEAALERFTGFLPGPGWVGFATADRLEHAGPIAAPIPDLVRWQQGPMVAPYLRALKHARPVVVALLDNRRARLFSYHAGRLTEVVDLLAERYIGDLSDTNISKRATGHSGVRGETATDAAAAALAEATRRMLKDVAEQVHQLAGRDGLILVGAQEDPAAALLQQLGNGLGNRVLHDHALHIEISTSRLRDAVAARASELNRRLQEVLVDEVVAAAGPGQRGCLGEAATEHALARHQVDTLMVSDQFFRARPDRAEELVERALDSGAAIEHLLGDSADRLVTEGGGVGARLRYVLVAKP